MKKPSRARKARTEPAVHVPAELQQLATIRARFAPLARATAAGLLAAHDDDACRARGGDTRARDTFRGAMSWARTLGAHATEPAVPRELARWFLDCLTQLGALLAGHTVARDPSAASALDDATHAADVLLRRTLSRAHEAVGTNAAWRAQLDAALADPPGLDARAARLNALVALLEGWLAPHHGERAVQPPVASYGVSSDTVASLRAAAAALDTALANQPAPRGFDHDSPAMNVAEGRLFYAMRALWNRFADEREAGTTTLLLAVTPAILRGLNLHARKATAARAKSRAAAAEPKSGRGNPGEPEPRPG